MTRSAYRPKQQSRASDDLLLPTRIVALMRAPKRLSAQRLWMGLEAEERSAALRTVLRDKESRAKIVAIVAEARNFRRITVQNWDDEKIVGQARHIRLANPLAALMLHALHRERRREMLARFLDALDIPNDDGQLNGDAEFVEALQRREFKADDVWAAADDLEREHGLRRVVVYFLTLAIREMPFAGHLWTWMRGVSERTKADEDAGLEVATPDDADLDEDTGAEGDPGRHRSFTTLDRILVRALVDSRQEVVGSLDEDEVDDAVDEFVNLNGGRPQSYYHAGFRDILFNRGRGPASAAITADQARWYWAGAVIGWARTERWPDMILAYDEHAAVRGLGDGADTATEEPARHIVRALARDGRVEDVAEFVRAPALRLSPGLFREVLEVGTEALRGGEEGPARAIFDRLMEAVRILEEEGQPPALKRFLDVRRRRAHCLQRALEHDRARRLLEELLEIDPDPNHMAMVHADLGLLAGRFNSLEDVRLPSDLRELRDLLDRLGEGREHFQRSVGNDVAYAAHGHYCLGVLALGENVLPGGEPGYAVAEDHLFRARTRFGQRRRSYGPALVARTNLYFAAARAGRAESAGDLTQAARILGESLRAGVPLPAYLVEPVVRGLDVGAAIEDQRAFAAALLDNGGTDALDVLAGSGQAPHRFPEVIDGLWRRAGERGSSEAAAADLRVCLAGYLEAGRHDEAAHALDRIETLAHRNIGSAAFEQLLAEKGYEPVWEPEEAIIAQARCLDAAGKGLEALQLLQQLAHQYASDGNLHDAEGVLATIRSLGLDRAFFVEVEERIAALARQHGPSPSAEATEPSARVRRVRVLFVGGDERQAKGEQAVQDLLKRRAPHVTVKFIYPGWGGNWNVEWDRVRRELPRHDAVVLMRFMRTQLGRQIRKHCDQPWRFCWARGRKGVTDAILEAAAAARGSG